MKGASAGALMAEAGTSPAAQHAADDAATAPRRASLARGGADGGRLEVKMAKLLWKTKDMSEVRGSVMEA